jgi:hypothetical protein
MSTFCVCAEGFHGFFKSFYFAIQLLSLFASLKLLTNFENAYRHPPHNSLLCDWSLFSNVDPHRLLRIYVQDELFNCHRRLPV